MLRLASGSKLWDRELMDYEMEALLRSFEGTARVSCQHGMSIISLICNVARTSEILEQARPTLCIMDLLNFPYCVACCTFRLGVLLPCWIACQGLLRNCLAATRCPVCNFVPAIISTISGIYCIILFIILLLYYYI